MVLPGGLGAPGPVKVGGRGTCSVIKLGEGDLLKLGACDRVGGCVNCCRWGAAGRAVKFGACVKIVNFFSWFLLENA